MLARLCTLAGVHIPRELFEKRHRHAVKLPELEEVAEGGSNVQVCEAELLPKNKGSARRGDAPF